MLPDVRERVDTFRHDGSCVCFVCGDNYEVEPDAFGDGCVTYYFPLMTEKMLGPDADDD